MAIKHDLVSNILNMKRVKKMFAYLLSTIMFHLYTFLVAVELRQSAIAL